MTGIGPPSATYDPNAAYAASASQNSAADYAAFMASYQHPNAHPPQSHHPHSYDINSGNVGIAFNDLTMGMGMPGASAPDMYSGSVGNTMFYQVQQQQPADHQVPAQSQTMYHHSHQRPVPTTHFNFEVPRQQTYHLGQQQPEPTFASIDYANAHSHGTSTSGAPTIASSTPRTSATPTVSSGTPPVPFDYQQQQAQYYHQQQAHQQTYAQPHHVQQTQQPSEGVQWSSRAPGTGNTGQQQHEDRQVPQRQSSATGSGMNSGSQNNDVAMSASASGKHDRPTTSRKGGMTGSATAVAGKTSGAATSKAQGSTRSRKRPRPAPADDFSGSEDDDDDEVAGMNSSWMLNMPSIPGLRYGVEGVRGGSRL